MGSIIGNTIDYNGVGALRGLQHILSNINLSIPPLDGNGRKKVLGFEKFRLSLRFEIKIVTSSLLRVYKLQQT